MTRPEFITLITILIVLMITFIAFAIIVYKKFNKENTSDDTKLINLEENQTNLNTRIIEVMTLINQINQSLTDQSSRNIKSFGEFKFDVIQNLELKIKELNKHIGQQLDKNIENATQAYQKIAERVTRLDQTKEQMETLNKSVLSLNNVLQDKKSRGVFGEVQLYHLLENVFSDRPNLYQKQYKLQNGNVVDAVVFSPEPLGIIPIDSKFPLENYRVSVDLDNDEKTRNDAAKKFRDDVRKHITDINKKYLTNEMSQYAVMFVPAEAVFAEIHSNYDELLTFAQKSNIWLASPSTLIYILSMIIGMISNIEKAENIKDILEDLSKLKAEFDRLADRWDTFNRSMNSVRRTSKDFDITVGKIVKQFNDIYDNQQSTTTNEEIIIEEEDE